MLGLTWKKGGKAQLLECNGEFVILSSTISAPPGQPLSAETADGVAFHIKVRSCQRQSGHPPSFRIEGRLFNLAKEQRDYLQQAIQAEAAEAATKLPEG
jgi:hypothetical protein